MLVAQKRGKVDSWAIRWYFSVFMAGGLVLYPVKSLIQNIGFDGSGTHCGISAQVNTQINPCSKVKNQQINFPEISIDNDVYHKIKLLISSKRTIVMKLKSIFSKIYRKTISNAS